MHRIFVHFEIYEDKHNEGKKQVWKKIKKGKKKVKTAKKSLAVDPLDPYEEELKNLKLWRGYLCEFEGKSRNGLKAHLSSGTHNKNSILLASQSVFPNPPHKCIVCFARLSNLKVLENHIAMHSMVELLDRCIDFSHNSAMNESDDEDSGGSMINFLKMHPQEIKTDSESESDSDDDHKPLIHISKENDMTINDSDSQGSEEVPDYKYFDKHDPDIRGVDKFSPRPQFALQKIPPGFKCYVCEVFLSSKKEREDHLVDIHQIGKNHDILSFMHQQARNEMESSDNASDEKIALINSLDNERRPTVINERDKRRGKPLICTFCDRVFESYDHVAHIKHEEMHTLTHSVPSA